ncbi:hypothetical protein SLS62_009850 [Diatrype stigma]|uniref:Magnesium chelatase n=1 Tax=Diatrype stigma TaxID=117547 RepID=A0AAN9YIG3_9PEZI
MAADEDQLLLRKVHGLGDLDLAALLSLIGREHCIIGTAAPVLNDLVAELRLVASHTFGLESAVVDCTPHTTLDDLASALLVAQQPPPPPPSQSQPRSPRSTTGSPLATRITTDSYFNHHHHHHHQHTRHGNAGSGGGAAAKYPSASTHLDGQAHPQLLPSPLRARTPTPATATSPGLNYGYGRTGYGGSGGGGGGKTPPSAPHIANVIIAKNLDAAPKAVQIQCLELLRTRRLFTRTSVQAAPKQFLFVAVLATTTGGSRSRGGSSKGPNGIAARLTPHLNDFFYISHWHDPEDGFAHLEEEEGDDDDDDEIGERERERAFRGDGRDYHANDGDKDKYGDWDDDTDSVRADTASFESAESVVRRSVAGTPRVNFNNSNSTPKERNTRTPRGSRSRRTTITDDNRGHGRNDSDNHNENRFDTPNKIDTHDNYNNYNYNHNHQPQPPLLSEHDVATLALAAREVAVDIDVLRYEMNVVSFLRLHRAVAAAGGGGGGGVGSGVTPASTKHLQQLVRALAALHGLAYATPALVGLAARKAYLHRLRVVVGADAARRERSMQWGSDRAAVAALLDGVGAEEVIEDALGAVAAPL